MRRRLFDGAAAAFLMAAICLGFALSSGCATEKPVTRDIDLGHVPEELVNGVRTAYPDAVLERAEREAAQTGTAYRIYFHAGDERHYAEFFRYRSHR